MAINFISADVSLTLKVTTGASSTAAAELPRNKDGAGSLYFVTNSKACYVQIGGSGVGAASSSAFTFYLPDNFWGSMYLPGKFVRAIQDAAASTLVFHAVKDDGSVGA